MSPINQQSSSKERFWRTMVEQWRGSGLSVRAFCARRSLSEPSFYAWRRTLQERDAAQVRFVPVQVVAQQTAPAANDTAASADAPGHDAQPADLGAYLAGHAGNRPAQIVR